jgi:type II secretory pathway component PulK
MNLAIAAGSPSLQGGGTDAADSAKNVDWTALLPEGEGRLETTVYCTGCHNMQTIIEKRRLDESGWKDTANRMVFSNGAAISEQDVDIISHYLAQHFGPNVPVIELPVNVNSSSKELLQLLPGMTSENVEKVLAARNQANIKDFSQLEAILGKENVDKLKQLISFD